MPSLWVGPLMIEGQQYPVLPDWVMSSDSLLPDSGVMNSLLPDYLMMNNESTRTKTYDMVDDPATDAVVSWRPDGRSFVVWDIPRFKRDLLPKHFNHNQFNSFTLQLLICGFKFRLLTQNRAEFAKVGFVRGKRHLLYLQPNIAKLIRRGETDQEEIKTDTKEGIKEEIKQVKKEIKDETKEITKVEIKKVKEEIKEVKDLTSSSIQKFKKRRIDGLSACSSSS